MLGSVGVGEFAGFLAIFRNYHFTVVLPRLSGDLPGWQRQELLLHFGHDLAPEGLVGDDQPDRRVWPVLGLPEKVSCDQRCVDGAVGDNQYFRRAGGQGSDQLTAMARADALALAPDGVEIAPGDEVEILPLR